MTTTNPNIGTLPAINELQIGGLYTPNSRTKQKTRNGWMYAGWSGYACKTAYNRDVESPDKVYERMFYNGDYLVFLGIKLNIPNEKKYEFYFPEQLLFVYLDEHYIRGLKQIAL